MKIEIGAKTTSGEREVQVKSLTTAAKWFLWSKVAIDGKTYTTTDGYFEAMAAMPEADKAECLQMATKLCVASHNKSVSKSRQSGRGFWN